MRMVIDASITLAWYFDDEITPATDAVLERLADEGAIVPTLWRLEVANGLQSALRRKRITPAYRDEALNELGAMPITIDANTDEYAWTTTLQLAERFTLTVYDATYLELAQRRSLPLATLDAELRNAASRLNISLLGVVA